MKRIPKPRLFVKEPRFELVDNESIWLRGHVDVYDDSVVIRHIHAPFFLFDSLKTMMLLAESFEKLAQKEEYRSISTRFDCLSPENKRFVLVVTERGWQPNNHNPRYIYINHNQTK